MPKRAAPTYACSFCTHQFIDPGQARDHLRRSWCGLNHESEDWLACYAATYTGSNDTRRRSIEARATTVTYLRQIGRRALLDKYMSPNRKKSCPFCQQSFARHGTFESHLRNECSSQGNALERLKAMIPNDLPLEEKSLKKYASGHSPLTSESSAVLFQKSLLASDQIYREGSRQCACGSQLGSLHTYRKHLVRVCCHRVEEQQWQLEYSKCMREQQPESRAQLLQQAMDRARFNALHRGPVRAPRIVQRVYKKHKQGEEESESESAQSTMDGSDGMEMAHTPQTIESAEESEWSLFDEMSDIQGDHQMDEMTGVMSIGSHALLDHITSHCIVLWYAWYHACQVPRDIISTAELSPAMPDRFVCLAGNVETELRSLREKGVISKSILKAMSSSVDHQGFRDAVQVMQESPDRDFIRRQCDDWHALIMDWLRQIQSAWCRLRKKALAHAAEQIWYDHLGNACKWQVDMPQLMEKPCSPGNKVVLRGLVQHWVHWQSIFLKSDLYLGASSDE